ncbi:hypothetical protein KKG45_08055 [bacterium]|nr:hypothetical protein [bacterium]MBU1073186.1 hypothetical protein [bacterium]MBU1675575.1 hypothetical protein [bacterium]
MKTLTCMLAALALLAGVASAADLWDQTGFDPWGAGFFNVAAGGPPFGMTVYTVNHVTVEADNQWTISSISTYYSALDPGWGGSISQGYVNVFSKTGPLPIDGVDDPSAGMLVPMSAVLDVDHFVVTASGLNITLNPGEYWIGMTPMAASGPMGPEIHLSTTSFYGDASASFDQYAFPGPPAWFNFNPGVDAAILIQGNLIVANEEMVWGELKSLYR